MAGRSEVGGRWSSGEDTVRAAWKEESVDPRFVVLDAPTFVMEDTTGGGLAPGFSHISRLASVPQNARPQREV
jgi:hypothetical protein